ncbi:MAG: DUF2807 domain-containing protein [Acidobacteria bacterium]|nr:DUF2807 domain-containing protein [Acidobacteriota bacterium]
MKKVGIIIFIAAIAVGVVISNVFSFASYVGSSPISFSFGSKLKGSGNLVTEQRDLKGFTGIDVSGAALQVEITAQKEYSVVIEADDNLMPLIKTEINGRTLQISTKKSFRTKNRIKVKISAPNIDSIENSGVTYVSLTNLSTDSLKIDSSGASKVKVEGTAKNLKVDISGASHLEASGLITNEANVESSGASSSKINVKDRLIADISGASSLKYKGNPENVVKHSSGVSSIHQID